MKSLFKICLLIIVQSYDTIHGENPKLTALKNSKKGHFGLVGFRQVMNASGDYIENVLGDKVKFNESIHSWNNISYKYLTECDVKYPLNKFMFTTTNQYEHNTYRKRFFQQDSREEMFTKKYEAKYAKLRAASTARTTRFTKATNMFDSKMMWDNLLEQYPDARDVMVTLKPWPRKLWTGTYPPVEPKVHPNLTTPEDWSLDIRKTYSEEDYQGPDRRLDPKDSISAYGMSLAKEKVHYDDEYNSQILPELERQWKIRGIIGNVKISIDVLMKSIMNNKKSARWCRSRRNVMAGATLAATEYAGKVEDPHSNCCQNEESREEFRQGLAKLKMKKFKNLLDDITPPKVKVTEATTVPDTVKTPCTGEAKTRVRRNVEDLYPSIGDSGDSHNLRKFGIQHDDRTVTLPQSTRWPTTPKIINLFNMTKSKLIKDVEKRFSLDIDKLTTPFTFKWSPYGLVITDSEQLDSDSELEVMDWYEERESPTWTTLPPTTDPFKTEAEVTMYDYDGMTQFNIENIRKIEKKFNVSLKDLANRTDNMRIRAKTLGYGLHGARDLMKNFPTADTLIDKYEPDLTPVFPTDWGFFYPNGTQIEEYGNRDWVLKDILAKWRQENNGSFETLHRKAENMTWEMKKKECERLGIPWTPPVRLVKSTEKTTQRNNWYTGCTWDPRDERFMDEHFKHVEYVNEYNRKHDLFPYTGKTEGTTLDPESEECQRTIMDWIQRGWTQSHENKHSSHKKRNKRDITSSTKYNIKIDFNENVTGSGQLFVNPDCLQTFDDPAEFGEAVKQLYGNNKTILGREDMAKKIKEMEEEKANKREKRQINGVTPNVPKRRLKRDMPYLGYSGLSSRIIFEWTNYPYFKTKQPFQIKREKIQAKHNPTNEMGMRRHIKKKWTIFTTKEPAQQSFKWVDGIPVREKLDYNDMQTVLVPGRLKRDVNDGTTTIGATFETPISPDTTLDSETTTSSSAATSQSTVAETGCSNLVNGTQVNGTISVNGSITSSTQNSSTPISLLNAAPDNDSQAPGSKLINSVHTLGRKKRALGPHKRKKRLKGQVLFEKIIQAYFNCKNVWKEPDAPEILQIRRRYREQKNRPLDRIFGRRSHNHMDIYYDRK
uniref:HTH cro/C1-type domain-containing protein n=1 Tax=Cacopsylla melanoneura TaxID=428564 RepID=A0A8D8TS44_9HEMI